MTNMTLDTKNIKLLDMNGLSGRVLQLPAPSGKTTEILFVYDQHSSLERWAGVAQFLNRYGAVTMPDLPGFGGMTSYYHIGGQPSIDNLADYLAAFVKLRYRRKRVAIVGAGLGFAVATRMLQRCPELTKHVRLLAGLWGIVHYDDLRLPPRRLRLYRLLARVCAAWLPAKFITLAYLNRSMLSRMLARQDSVLRLADPAARQEIIDHELALWQQNDLRTHAHTTHDRLKLDNCRSRIDVPVWYVALDKDPTIDPNRVEQHLHVTFSDVHIVSARHAYPLPNILAAPATVAALIPPALRRALARD